jgi:DNA-binding transcriptional LysR family regulator
MPNANDLMIFAKTVEYGGFASAAKRLAMPKSTVSKRVAELEAELGARLVNRTSRSFALTEVGRDVYEHAKAASIEIEGAQSAVRRRLAEPSGTVRMTVSVAMLHFELAQKLPSLLGRYPKLHVSVHATDHFVDVIKEGFDIAVRSHFAPLPDSDLSQRKMRVEQLILVASPAYLEQQGTPSHPSDLVEHHGLPGARFIASHAAVFDLNLHRCGSAVVDTKRTLAGDGGNR